jgi:ubiquinone/menaquinone biosynthesis C-methylase UbiE
MTKLEFDHDLSHLVEKFNAAPHAVERRGRILNALALRPGDRVFDVGSGPGNQAFVLSSVVGSTGRIGGVDVADSAIEIARDRCIELDNVHFRTSDASGLPFNEGTFDAVISSQVFEYLDDVAGGLAEVFRVSKTGGRVLIHDTD